MTNKKRSRQEHNYAPTIYFGFSEKRYGKKPFKFYGNFLKLPFFHTYGSNENPHKRWILLRRISMNSIQWSLFTEWPLISVHLLISCVNTMFLCYSDYPYFLYSKCVFEDSIRFTETEVFIYVDHPTQECWISFKQILWKLS